MSRMSARSERFSASPHGRAAPASMRRPSQQGWVRAVRCPEAGSCRAQTIDTLGHEALLPTSYAGLGLARRHHDGNSTQVLIPQQNDPYAPDMLMRRTLRRNNRFKPSFVRGCDLDPDTSAHLPISHVPPSQGIPKRTLCPDQTTTSLRRFQAKPTIDPAKMKAIGQFPSLLITDLITRKFITPKAIGAIICSSSLRELE